MSESEFGGQVAVVTGGTEGIGFATAKLLAERGARVCILDVNEAAMEDACARLSNTGSVSAYMADVTDEAAVLAARDAILAEHGQVAVGGRDHPHLDLQLLGATHPLEGVIIQGL